DRIGPRRVVLVGAGATGGGPVLTAGIATILLVGLNFRVAVGLGTACRGRPLVGALGGWVGLQIAPGLCRSDRGLARASRAGRALGQRVGRLRSWAARWAGTAPTSCPDRLLFFCCPPAPLRPRGLPRVPRGHATWAEWSAPGSLRNSTAADYSAHSRCSWRSFTSSLTRSGWAPLQWPRPGSSA